MRGSQSDQFVHSIQLKRNEVKSYALYPFNLPIVKSLNRLQIDPHLTFIVGDNGSGKSTLLEAIAASLGFNPEGGSKNFSFGTRESHSDLHKYLRVCKGIKKPKDGYFLRAESFFNVATEIEKRDEEPGGGPKIIESYGGTSLHEQSHGESFLSLVCNRFRGNGLYLLDEPEAALSPQRQLSVLSRMHQLIQRDSQFIIATHSPILMAYPDALIYGCTPEGLKKVQYEDTEHFRVTRDFLANPNRMLRELFKDDDDLSDDTLFDK
ncbi:MAG TPA: AAA family ATPase [Planctomycetota bacterium]|nr:AAA family ATPase [Planctomycetota bacterium]